MRARQDPNSRFYVGNRNYDDVEEIVFSDEEEGFKKQTWLVLYDNFIHKSTKVINDKISD